MKNRKTTLQKRSISCLWMIRYSFFLYCCFPLPLLANPNYQYNQSVQDIYHQLLDLDFAKAQEQLAQLEQHQPDNLARYHLANYYDFLQVYTSDDPKLYKELKAKQDGRLQELAKGPRDSPWHLFSQAEVYLQWALLRFRFGDYWSGFLGVKKAYQLLEKNQKSYPSFAPNYKDLGILHAMIGTVPDQYQWGLKLLTGLDGTVQQGKAEMQLALKDQNAATAFLQQETTILYCFLLLHLDKDPTEAWHLIRQQTAQRDNSILVAFTFASVATRSGHNNQVIKILEIQKSKANWSKFPFLEFTLGNAKLRQLDSEASAHFERFLNQYQGQNDLKATHLRLAWCALLKKDKNKYLFHLKTVQSIGNKTNGRDKDAMHLADFDFIPNLQLLKARLLFDGGYYAQAQNELSKLQHQQITQVYETLELDYRKARIAHRLQENRTAIQHYQKVIQAGETQPYYFACNAALQLGIIYEDQGMKAKAAQYYKQCLQLKPDIYRNSLHLSAKAGLQRLE